MTVVLRMHTAASILCALLTTAEASAELPAPQPPAVAGTWRGTMTAAGSRFQVVLNLTRTSAGQVAGTLDLPSAGASNLLLEHVEYTDRILSFDVNVGSPSHYEGVVSRDAMELVGHLRQGGNVIVLNLAHADTKPDTSVAKPAILANPRRKLELQPCGVDGVTRDALCAQYEVYEDRAKNAGRKIRLNVMVLPALADKPAPSPTFYLVGGPGGAATSSAGAWFMTRLHRTHDVVLVDQRGTGRSNPLPCSLRGDPDDMRGYFVEPLTAELVRACRMELETHAELRLYSTAIAMADLDDVRDALGYDKVDVYGGSYGATAALSYLARYPQRVRTVTVFGVSPPNSPVLLPFARGVENALSRLFDDCAADEKCRLAFPALRQDWATVVALLSTGPVTFDALNPVTRQKQQVTMTREGLAELVRVMLYVPSVMGAMPLLIRQLSQGDYLRFAYYAFQVQRGVDAGLSRGMQLSVFCAENVPLIAESDIEPATRGTFYGGARARLFLQLCREWPHDRLPARLRDPIRSDVPVLMLSGELDPVTPPDLATPLLRWLPNGRQIIVHDATHASYECTEKLARDFIDQGTTKGLDEACVAGIKRQPFLTSLPPLPVPR